MDINEALTKIRQLPQTRGGKKARQTAAVAILIAFLGEYISRDEQLDLVEALHPLFQ